MKNICRMLKKELYIFELQAFFYIFRATLNSVERKIYCKVRIHIVVYNFNSFLKINHKDIKIF